MKGGVVVTVLAAVLSFSVAARADDFAVANAAYTEGKFAEAKLGYERILARGWRANVAFNLGNTNFRLNEPGRAALAYERVLLMDPRHPEALANLKFVREKFGARTRANPALQNAERFSFVSLATWVVVGAGWLGIAMIGAALWRGRRGVLFWSGVLFLLAGAVCLGGILSGQRAVRALAIVVAEKAEARMEPADRAALAEALPPGSRVRVISEQGDWIYCELPGGGRGWVGAGQIERLLPGGKV